MKDTTSSEPEFTISKLAEFSDRNTESIYLQHEVAEAVKHIPRLLLALAAVYALFGVADWFLLDDPPLFVWITCIRVAVILPILALYMLLRSEQHHHWYHLLLTVCEISVATGFGLILFNYRSPDFGINAFWASLMIWCFTTVPNKWRYTLAASIYSGAAFLAIAVHRLGPIQPSHLSATIYFIALTIGIAGALSYSLCWYRRSNYAALQRLGRLSQTDGLTGLLNRLGLDDQLRAMLSSSRRLATPLALIMLDLDDFKEVNDQYGHLYGDSVLVSIAGCLRSAMPPIGTLGRWGGEEFVLLLPGYDLDQASEFAEELRDLLARQRYAHGTGVTCSFGVTVAATGETPESILRRADELLYAAKEAGKNRVASRLAGS